MKTVITDEKIPIIEELHYQGKTAKYIAEQINVNVSTLQKYMHKKFGDCTKHVMIDFNIVEDLYVQGYTFREIAKELGISVNTLRDRIHEKQREDPTFLYIDTSCSAYRRKNCYQVKQLFQENYTDKEIAEKVGITERTVRHYRQIIYHSADTNKEKMRQIIDKNNILIRQNNELTRENERLKRELEASYNLDCNISEVPALKRRIYDLEEMYDQITNTLIVLTASMSSVKYTEYEKQESENV